MNRTIPIAVPVTGDEEWQALREPVFSGWLTQGPKVSQFERAFAERHKVEFAIAVTSCTTALHLALAALDIGEGDEVIVPAFTWVATANVVLYCGATPVFCDIDRETFNIDPDKLKVKLTPRTKAVVLVHLFGLCSDIDKIKSIIPSNVKIIEDAACAAGAEYKGVSAGGLGDVAAFSFHPRKSITTGEGGMVTTNSPGLAEKMSQMRNHGASISEEQRHIGSKPYILPEFNLLGFNYRMTDLQGAVGLVQLQKLDQFIDERARWAEWYRGQLEDIDWMILPNEPELGKHGWQSFVVRIDPKKAPMSRNEIMEKLQEKGVSSRPGTHALHLLGLYREKYSLNPTDFPAALDCHENSMAIPLHNKMEKEDYKYVVEAIRAI